MCSSSTRIGTNPWGSIRRMREVRAALTWLYCDEHGLWRVPSCTAVAADSFWSYGLCRHCRSLCGLSHSSEALLDESICKHWSTCNLWGRGCGSLTHWQVPNGTLAGDAGRPSGLKRRG